MQVLGQIAVMGVGLYLLLHGWPILGVLLLMLAALSLL